MEKYRKELQRIYKRDGALRPSVIVTEAAKEKNPLHEYFEWDDAKAGHQFRLVQCRTLIRKVRVIDHGGSPEPIIHVPSISREEGEYHPRSVVVSQPDSYDRALSEALSKMGAARAAVDELREMKPRKDVTKASKLVEQAHDLIEGVRAGA